jgi:hypothetical protein
MIVVDRIKNKTLKYLKILLIKANKNLKLILNNIINRNILLVEV